MYGVLDISTSALVAQRANLDVIAGNIAMKDVTRDEDGNSVPYRRRVALMAAGDGGEGGRPGVHVTAVVEDPSAFGLRWDPDHVDAVKEGPEQGYVRISNVDYHTEMVNAMAAARAYEANVTVMEAAKSMVTSTLQLIA
ncbi:MAG: flagellar basal body rod protein FlgC [Planctomycetes bacterium]|nr:flagellar basal body rod protein FlgC [Planctomycetota bacterium]